MVLVSALPDDLPVLVVAVPDLRSVEFSAVPTEDFPGEYGVASMRSTPATLHLVLNLQEGLCRDDGVVILFNMVHWYFALVPDSLLMQEIQRVGLLEDFVAHVGLVGQNAVNRVIDPYCFAARP